VAVAKKQGQIEINPLMKEVYVRALLEKGSPSLASLCKQGLELSMIFPSAVNQLFSEVQLALNHGEVTKAHT